MTDSTNETPNDAVECGAASAEDTAAQVAGDQSAPGPAGVLTDVRWKRAIKGQITLSVVMFGLMVPIMCFTSIITGAVSQIFNPPAWVRMLSMFLPMGLLGGGAYWAMRSSVVHGVKNDVEVLGACTTDVLVDETLKGRRMLLPGAALAQLARSLMAVGRAGETVRVDAKPAVGVQPISDTFEIQPLDESAVEPGLLGDAPPPRGLARWLPGAGQLMSARSDGARSLRRAANYRGGVGYLVSLPFSILVLGAMLYFGAFPPRFIYFLAPMMLVGFFFASPAFFAMLFGEWFVVPGAVVIRKARSFGRGADVRMLRRTESVLCVHRVQQRWQVIVADGEHTHRTLVSEPEAIFLLRAWLSPVPPPPMERVRELL